MGSCHMWPTTAPKKRTNSPAISCGCPVSAIFRTDLAVKADSCQWTHLRPGHARTPWNLRNRRRRVHRRPDVGSTLREPPLQSGQSLPEQPKKCMAFGGTPMCTLSIGIIESSVVQANWLVVVSSASAIEHKQPIRISKT